MKFCWRCSRLAVRAEERMFDEQRRLLADLRRHLRQLLLRVQPGIRPGEQQPRMLGYPIESLVPSCIAAQKIKRVVQQACSRLTKKVNRRHGSCHLRSALRQQQELSLLLSSYSLQI